MLRQEYYFAFKNIPLFQQQANQIALLQGS